MKLNTQIFIAIFLFFGVSCYGQICESFNRKLFSLSEEIPNQINCKDSLGRKQGWWIYYKIQYNPEENTELNIGDYVPDYVYGKYKNDFKIGTWITVNNVHLIYDKKKERYYYGDDTTIITSEFADGGWKESYLFFNDDKSIIHSKSIFNNSADTICIDCKTNKDQSLCRMTYKMELIKTFFPKDFDWEFDKTFIYPIAEEYLRKFKEK